MPVVITIEDGNVGNRDIQRYATISLATWRPIATNFLDCPVPCFVETRIKRSAIESGAPQPVTAFRVRIPPKAHAGDTCG